MSKKGKFDLTSLVHAGFVTDGETIYFVSDPAKTGNVKRQPNGEYKLDLDGEAVTPHAAAHRFLGQEPSNHAAQWLRNGSGKTLFQLWQAQQSGDY